MMKRLKDDCLAEMALGAMVSMIALILASAVLGGLLLGLVEFTFAESKQHASTQSDSLNGLIMITTVELTELVDPGDDTIYLTFEFPYLTDAIADEDIVYSVLCDNGASVSYNSGNFDSATDIFGNADDAGALDFFEIGQMYHMEISLSGACDIEPNMSAELVIAMEGGRVKTVPFTTGSNPQIGDSYL